MFALPSVDEAFGVAYVEAMAAGVPAIGCRGEAGPEEIARQRPPGSGSSRPATRRRSPRSCARCSTTRSSAASSATAPARPSSARSPGRACGRETVAAYEEALR